MNKLKSMALCSAMALCVTACGTSPKQELKREYSLLQDQYAALQEEVVELESYRDSLKDMVVELESYRDSLKDMIEQEDKPAHVITFEVSQSHLTLDIGTLIKDAMNTTEFEVMVDKRYYDSVEIGQSINSDFRIGSLLIKMRRKPLPLGMGI